MIYLRIIEVQGEDENEYDIDASDIRVVPQVGDFLSHPYKEGKVYRVTERTFYYQRAAEDSQGKPTYNCTVFLKVDEAPHRNIQQG
jgi:hypothetical protein